MKDHVRNLTSALEMMKGACRVTYEADPNIGLVLEPLDGPAWEDLETSRERARSWIAALDDAFAPGLVASFTAHVDPAIRNPGWFSCQSARLWSRTTYRLLGMGLRLMQAEPSLGAAAAVVRAASRSAAAGKNPDYDVTTDLRLRPLAAARQLSGQDADALGDAIARAAAAFIAHNARWLRASGLSQMTLAIGMSDPMSRKLLKEASDDA